METEVAYQHVIARFIEMSREGEGDSWEVSVLGVLRAVVVEPEPPPVTIAPFPVRFGIDIV